MMGGLHDLHEGLMCFFLELHDLSLEGLFVGETLAADTGLGELLGLVAYSRCALGYA